MTTHNTHCTARDIAAELDRIGSVYRDRYPSGWQHRDMTRGPALVAQLCRARAALANQTPSRPRAHGPKGEPGTVICGDCGKRGQETGTVCDHCGAAV